MVFIGDLYQLPPVLTWQESKAFRTIYKSPYFFSSHAFQDYNFEVIELDKIYRQSDQEFINLLNNVRVNEMTPADFRKLNSRNMPYTQDGNMIITLTTTKALAEIVNNYFMGELPGKETQYQGTLMGSFDKSYMPTAMDLQLKVGAQVMMLNNDPGGRWVNGTIGKLEQIADKFVKVHLAGQDDAIRIDPYRWEIFRTFLNDDNKLETSSIGSFSQLPLMPAWAITIHKSQGKTFDKIIINTGSRGAFAHGQVYVALSRCRDLEGIVLRQPIQPNHIHVDQEIKEFMKK